jgi:DNA-binding CsgD family transcriptional regulator
VSDLPPNRDPAPTDWLLGVLRGPVDALAARFSFSTREKDVLRMTAAGMHTKAVAATLGCASKTVEEYWKRIFLKVGSNSRHLIVAMVLAEVLAGPSPPLPSRDELSKQPRR